MAKRITERWHFAHEGRTYILYGNDYSAVCDTATRFAGTLTMPKPSGHYDRKTNTIVDAQDGPTEYFDARKSGM